jgi:hypothetical protein
MKSAKKLFFLATFLIISLTTINPLYAQIMVGNGVISGDFALNGMFYQPDSLIGAEKVDSKVRANSWLNLQYTNSGFTVGARYEFYSFPLIDFEKIGYKGQGITNYFVDYKNDFIQVTAGTFYEQFGQGFTLRSYEDRLLGIDNSLLGMRVKATPYKGIYLKGVWGIERKNFDFNYAERNDYIRGLDAEVALADMIPAIANSGVTATIGGSFVSKFEKSLNDIYFSVFPNGDTIPVTVNADKIPQNVATWAGRVNLGYKGFRFEAEYANKANDPNNSNNYIYKNGEALFMSATYSMKGLGVAASFIRSDNMDFRSQRGISTNSLLSINYIPAINRQYSYQLLSDYAYACLPNGQIGFQAQVNYLVPKKTKIGGKYGTDITLSYCRFHDIDRVIDAAAEANGTMQGTEGYTSSFFKFGEELLYQDAGIEISRKFDKRWKLVLAYNYINYNLELLQGHGELVKAHHAGFDLTCKLNKKHALRLESQFLFTKQDNGNYVFALLEYSISPRWFFSIGDQWNYGNPNPDMRLHYYNVAASFVYGTTRVSLNFGKVKEGMLCIGGVCRAVPASYGLGLNITTTF